MFSYPGLIFGIGNRTYHGTTRPSFIPKGVEIQILSQLQVAPKQSSNQGLKKVRHFEFE